MIPKHIPCPTCKVAQLVSVRTRAKGEITDLSWRCAPCGHRLDASGIGEDDAVEDLRRRWRKRFDKR